VNIPEGWSRDWLAASLTDHTLAPFLPQTRGFDYYITESGYTPRDAGVSSLDEAILLRKSALTAGVPFSFK